jgi:hypothetical protein
VLISAAGSPVAFESCGVVVGFCAGDGVDCGAGDDWGAALEFGGAESGAVCARAGVKIPAQQNQRKMKTGGKLKSRQRLSERLTFRMPMGRPETGARFSSIHPMPYNVAHGKELRMTLLWRHASVN